MSLKEKMLPVNVEFESDHVGLTATVSMWGTSHLPKSEEAPDELIVIIPGNPGLVNFYYDYAQCLYDLTALPVWIISHAGHNSCYPIQDKRNTNNLHKQLKHKVEFLEKHTSPKSKVHLVGHSVGGWMSTEILQIEALESRIKSANLLFPTLEYIADTPNGYWLNNVVRNVTPIILLGVYIFTILPRFISKLLVHIYFLIVGYPIEYIPYVYFYLQVSVIQCCLGLAYDEMDIIKDLNTQTISRNTHRIKVIYADDDGWAPGKMFKKIKQTIPDLQMESIPIRHAFVMGQSEQVAEITSRCIQLQ